MARLTVNSIIIIINVWLVVFHRHSSAALRFRLSYTCRLPLYLHRESKKTRHQTLSHNFSNYYPIFKIFSLADSVVNLQQSHVSPRFKHVATLTCEIWMSENGIILKYLLQLMMNHKVVWPRISGVMSYFTTHLSFTLLVKEFLTLVNTWQSYRQNGWLCHTPHSPCTYVLKDADLAR